MKAKPFILLSIIACLISLEMCNKSSPTGPEAEPPLELGTKVGTKAIDFTAKDQHGNDVSLYDFSGNVVLIDFSADWCGPCQREAEHLEDLLNDYEQSGFRIVTVLTSGDPAKWAKDYGLTFPVLDDNSETIWDQYGEGAVPLNLVLDRDNVIRYKAAGYDPAQIRQFIEKYL
ncbi:peroxiredoxin family protein [Acidobacteriota bacterium]